MLFILATAVRLCNAQFTALVTGNVALSNWQGVPPADLLSGLHIRIISTDDNNGSVRPDEVQTDAKGHFSDNVPKGYIKVRATGRKNDSPETGRSTVLFGEYPVTGTVRVATKQTLTINPNLPARATVTGTETKKSESDLGIRNKMILLSAFIIPSYTHQFFRGDGSSGNCHFCVRINVINDQGHSLEHVSVTTVDVDSSNEQDCSPNPMTGQFIFNLKDNSALIVRIQSSGFEPRTLLTLQARRRGRSQPMTKGALHLEEPQT